ncbi:hypothetical protein DKT68_15275 [Micromonospora acroterricola]|uniref:HK97 gp10 family phage protein n=1 Tax=Micromonospora acroterricola TaxID=2202421 RepID=A0A317D499_9ACTN|nr:hypothetical protein [Micromonospora acroterricola]PWR08576.1 hypothetical protein DKT68_15275 [Micromonospora acroterricola]
MKISTESSQVNHLVAELAEVPEQAHDNIIKAVQFTANGIKKTSRELASGIAHAPDYPNAITYDWADLGVGKGVSAEIGPDKDRRQGPLGNILEYGTVNNPPYAHLGPALDRWSPDFVEGLEKAAADALGAL